MQWLMNANKKERKKEGNKERKRERDKEKEKNIFKSKQIIKHQTSWRQSKLKSMFIPKKSFLFDSVSKWNEDHFLSLLPLLRLSNF